MPLNLKHTVPLSIVHALFRQFPALARLFPRNMPGFKYLHLCVVAHLFTVLQMCLCRCVCSHPLLPHSNAAIPHLSTSHHYWVFYISPIACLTTCSSCAVALTLSRTDVLRTICHPWPSGFIPCSGYFLICNCNHASRPIKTVFTSPALPLESESQSRCPKIERERQCYTSLSCLPLSISPPVWPFNSLPWQFPSWGVPYPLVRVIMTVIVNVRRQRQTVGIYYRERCEKRNSIPSQHTYIERECWLNITVSMWHFKGFLPPCPALPVIDRVLIQWLTVCDRKGFTQCVGFHRTVLWKQQKSDVCFKKKFPFMQVSRISSNKNRRRKLNDDCVNKVLNEAVIVVQKLFANSPLSCSVHSMWTVWIRPVSPATFSMSNPFIALRSSERTCVLMWLTVLWV